MGERGGGGGGKFVQNMENDFFEKKGFPLFHKSFPHRRFEKVLKKVKKSVKNRVFHTFHRVFHIGVETFQQGDVENSSFSMEFSKYRFCRT